MNLGVGLLVATGIIGVVLAVSHLRGSRRVARAGWPVHAGFAVAGFAALTAELVGGGAAAGKRLIAYVFVLGAGALGVVVSAAKQGHQIPLMLLLAHASVGVTAVVLLVFAAV